MNTNWFVREGRILRIAVVSRIRRNWLRRTLLVVTMPLVMACTAVYLIAWWVFRLIGATILLPLEYTHALALLITSAQNRWAEPYTGPATTVPVEDAAEAAYWNFDARRKGYAEWSTMPQSERDAFKAEYRAAALIEACRQEHGGKHHESECPICEALAALDPQP